MIPPPAVQRWAERAIRRAMPSILQAFLCGLVEQEIFAASGGDKSTARTFSTAAVIKTWADRHTGANPGAIRAATEFALEAIGIEGRGLRQTGAATHAEHYRSSSKIGCGRFSVFSPKDPTAANYRTSGTAAKRATCANR